MIFLEPQYSNKVVSAEQMLTILYEQKKNIDKPILNVTESFSCILNFENSLIMLYTLNTSNI